MNQIVGNHYMLISTVLLILSFVPFALLFEKKKPRAREVVLIAVLSALTVIANLVCAYTIPFHAGTAMVIVVGIALGPEAGFLTGALSRFVCNFFAGQGVWTPWEMAAWGILGAISGVLFHRAEIKGYLSDIKSNKAADNNCAVKAIIPAVFCLIAAELAGYISFLFFRQENETFFGWRLYVFGVAGILISCVMVRRRLPANWITTTVYTFVSVFVIYGGIMNVAALFMNNAIDGGNSVLSWNAMKLLFITGAPYDAMHAAGAAVCVLLFGDSLIQKLERIQIKYGMYIKN